MLMPMTMVMLFGEKAKLLIVMLTVLWATATGAAGATQRAAKARTVVMSATMVPFDRFAFMPGVIVTWLPIRYFFSCLPNMKVVPNHFQIAGRPHPLQADSKRDSEKCEEAPEFEN